MDRTQTAKVVFKPVATGRMRRGNRGTRAWYPAGILNENIGFASF
jgi:hypothetical protein